MENDPVMNLWVRFGKRQRAHLGVLHGKTFHSACGGAYRYEDVTSEKWEYRPDDACKNCLKMTEDH